MNRNIIYIVSVVLALFLGSQVYAVTLPSTSYQPMSATSLAPAPSFTASASNNLPMQSYSSASSDYSKCQASGPNDVSFCPSCCEMNYFVPCLNEQKDPYACQSVMSACISACGGAASLPIPDAVPYLLALCATYAAVLYAKKRKEQQA